MIQFAFAAFMLGGLGAAIPIALHFLKGKPTVVSPFPDFMFLRQTLIEKHTRNKLRKWIILILRSLAFILLAAAFSWPYLPNFAKTPNSATVVLWDNSFSMAAKPYFNEMKAKALAILRQAGPKRPTILGLVAGGNALWLPRFTGKGDELAAFLESGVPGDGSGSFETALREADARLEEMPAATKKIVIVTDWQKLPWNSVDFSKKLSPGTTLKIITPDKPGFANVAITSAKILTPFLVAKRKIAISVNITNFSDSERQFSIETWLNSSRVNSEKVRLDAKATAKMTFFVSPRALEPAAVSFRLNVKDDIAVDNTYTLALNPSKPPLVAMAPSPGDCDFLRLALEAGAKIANIVPANHTGISKSKLVILRGAPNAKARSAAADALSNGKNIIVIWNPTSEMRTLLLSLGVASSTLTATDEATFSDIDFTHPFFKVFKNMKISPLFQIRFYAHPKLELPPDATVVAKFSDGDPAIAIVPKDKGEVIIIASKLDRDSTDWGIRPSFLPFIRELAAYALRSTNKHGNQYLVGEPVPTKGFSSCEALADNSFFKLGGIFRPKHPGAYLLTGNGVKKMIAVTVAPDESPSNTLPDDFNPNALVSKIPPPKTTAKAAAFSPEQGRTFWWILMLLAGIMIVSEMILSNRTTL